MFSGGKDSTAMLFLMIKKNIRIDEIVYCDLGVDFPEMKEHIRKVEVISGRKITIIKPDKPFGYWLGFNIKRKGNHINEWTYDEAGNKIPVGKSGVNNCDWNFAGELGYGWATMKIRWCTALKITTINNYLKSINDDITEFHGIASDEPERLLKNSDRGNIRYPLNEHNMTEKMALEYCYKLGFDWGGLYDIKNRVSCYVCPLQRIDDLRYLYNKRPELWDNLKLLDSVSFRKFKGTKSLNDIERQFINENNQLRLW